jgi:3-oxoacyl-[acyl-carrier protein] reductase
MDLKDKIVLVTGGSSGIGLAIALALQHKGAVVLVNGRNQHKLDAVSEKYGFVSFHCDVSKEDDVVEMFDKIKNDHGKIDALINNAGYGYFDKIENIDPQKFSAVYETNVLGAALAAREAAKIFKEQKGGAIINIASTAGTKGYAGGTPYVATKFALRGMTECWRAELRPYNVRVILINPSEVQTEFVSNAGFDSRDFNPTKLVAEDIAHTVVSALEMDDRGFITELTVFATNPKD